MTVEQKARQLAQTLVADDQNPEPLIEALIEIARWQHKQMVKGVVASLRPLSFFDRKKNL